MTDCVYEKQRPSGPTGAESDAKQMKRETTENLHG